MAELEFKYRHIHQDEGNTAYEAVIYEGATTTESELDVVTGLFENVTRFRRTSIAKTIEKDYGTKELESKIYSDLQNEVELINEGKVAITIQAK